VVVPPRLGALLPWGRRFKAVSDQIGIDGLVEVHDETELGRALEAGADFVGTNNRNLATFEVDLKVTEQLAPKLPEGCTIVSESGMRTALIWPCAPADSRNRPAKIIKPVDRHSVIKDGHN
jgi:hypothetical protein